MSERFAWIFDKEKQKKIWVADMWSRKRIIAIEQQLSSLQARIAALETDYTALEARVSALEGGNNP